MPTISSFVGMFMQRMTNMARMLSLVTQMDPAGPNYLGEVPPGLLLLSNYDDILGYFRR